MFGNDSVLSDIEDTWNRIFGDPPSGPGMDVEQAADECAGETCLPRSCFMKHPHDDRWVKFWKKQDGTPEGDMKAYKSVFEE